MHASLYRAVEAVFRKEARISLRSRSSWLVVLMFALTTLSCVSLLMQGDVLSPRLAAAMLWVILFFSLLSGAGRGFADEEQNKIYVDKSKRVLEKAKELGCDIVTTHIGRIPEEECAVKETMRKACRSLAEFADSMGSSFAVETGTESGRILCDFLDSLGAGGVRVNFDPANLVMVAGDRPERAVADVGKYIVHTHAKDGYKLDESLPEDVKIVIGGEAKDHEALLGMGRAYIEVPLGEGGVNFDTYLPALAATGFDGFLTVEREVGEDPCRDIGLAVRFLREKLEKMGL